MSADCSAHNDGGIHDAWHASHCLCGVCSRTALLEDAMDTYVWTTAVRDACHGSTNSYTQPTQAVCANPPTVLVTTTVQRAAACTTRPSCRSMPLRHMPFGPSTAQHNTPSAAEYAWPGPEIVPSQQRHIECISHPAMHTEVQQSTASFQDWIA